MDQNINDKFKVYCTENYRRILYFIFVTFSITLFTIHAILASIPYFNFEVYEDETSKMQWPVELPEITVCDNVISYNLGTTLNDVSTLSEQDRISPSNYVNIRCMFPDRQMDCEEYFKLPFNNLYYGTCKTLKTTKNAMDPKTAILMWNPGDAGFDLNRKRGRGSNIRSSIVVVVHEPWTEPILTPENVIRVGKACTSSCFQNLTMKYCKCIIPYLYFSHNWGKLPACYYCNTIPQDQLDQLCDCKPSCQEIKYKVTVKEVVGVSINLNFIDTILKNYKTSGDVATVVQDFHQWSLSIKMETLDVDLVTQYTLIDMTVFLSNFGGILGIWFGLSVMAIIEGMTIFSKKYSVIALGYIKTIVNATDETFPRIENTDTSDEKKEEEEEDYQISSVSTYNIFREVKSKSNAFYWSVIFVIVFSLAISQTIVLITDYLKWNVRTKESTVISQYEEFPSVTVCNGHNTTDYNPPLEEIVKSCRHQYRDNIKNCSKNQIVTFNNKKFGDCMTFNPGFIDKKDNLQLDGLTMWLNCRCVNTTATIQSQVGMGAVLLVHPKGTAPVMRSQEILTIQPLKFISLIYETTVFTRMKAPYKSKCVNEYDKESRKKIIYEEGDRKYIYTRDACVDGCIQNMTITNKDCRECYLAELLGRLKASAETRCISYCPLIDGRDMDNKCGCHQPCRSVSHKIKIIQERSLKKFNSTLAAEVKNHVKMNADDLRARFHNFEYREASCGFTLRPNSFQYAINEEGEKTDFLSLMSSIGGTFGLWLGLSFISLIELIQTLIRDATAIVKARNAYEH